MENLLVVISGPSGSGKSKTISSLLDKRKDFKRISTYTTRQPRQGEIDGEQYHFITDKEYFKLLDEGKLMACSKIENEYYGAPIIEQNRIMEDRCNSIIDMGVSGGIEIKEKYSDAVMIYLIPETEEQLLRQRGDRGSTRQARGVKQIQRILAGNQYEWLVKNGDIEETVKKVEIIIDFIQKQRMYRINKQRGKNV